MKSSAKRVPGRGFLASASIISTFSLLGVVAGFALNMLIAANYGIGLDVDAFFIAYTIPFLLQGFARASCTMVLVPAFSRYSATMAENELRRFFSASVSTAVVLGIILALIGILGSQTIVGLLAPGASAEVKSQSAELARILFGTLFMAGAISVLRAFLYSHEMFAVPTAIDGIQRLVAVVLVLAIGRHVGIVAVAYGYVLGTIAQLLVEVVVVVRRWGPKYYYINLNFTRDDVQTGQQLSYSLASSLLGQGTVIIDRIIASFLPVGSIAVLGYARQVMEVVVRILLSAAPLAIMPSISASLARKAHEEVREKLSQLFIFMSGISIPLGTYILLFSTSLIFLTFQRGSFDNEATLLTATTLSVYALGILVVGYFRVVEFYLYAQMKAQQVLLLFFIFGISTVLLDIVLARLLGIQGIALAYSLGLALALIVGIVQIRQSLQVSTWRRLLILNAKILGACAVTSVTTSFLTTNLKGISDLSGITSYLIIAGMGTSVFIVTLLIVVKILRVDELNSALAFVVSRLRRTKVN